MSSLDPSTRESALQSLRDFLLDAFDVNDLRQFVRFLPNGKTIVERLTYPASPAQTASEVVQLLDEMGYLRGLEVEEFFKHLLKTRSRRAPEVQELQCFFRNLGPSQSGVGSVSKDSLSPEGLSHGSHLAGRSSQWASGQVLRARRRLINRVKERWFSEPLNCEIPIELVLEPNRGRAVGITSRSVTSEIAEVFGSMDESVIIVGRPGAGKSTLLQKLAFDLLKRAEGRPEFPVPVIFHLASWVTGLDIKKWMITELSSRYYVPARVATELFVAESIVPIFDGLDEVTPSMQANCVLALNHYTKVESHALAVACRQSIYRDLGVKLECGGIVRLLPLSPSQILAHLQRGDSPGRVQTKLFVEQDPTVLKLLEQPLSLYIFIESAESLSKAFQITRLLDVYITRLIASTAQRVGVKPDKVKRWLAWLARLMQESKTVEFFVEDIQPRWIQNRALRVFYLAAVSITVSAIVNLVFWLYGLLRTLVLFILLDSPISIEPLFHAYSWFAIIPPAVIAAIIIHKKPISPTPALGWAWSIAKSNTPLGLSVVILLGSMIFNEFGSPPSSALEVTLWLLLSGSIFFVLGLTPLHIPKSVAPNSNIYHSILNSIKIFFGGVAVVLFIDVSLATFDDGSASRLLVAAQVMAVLLVALKYGGLAGLQHTVTRVILAIEKTLPLNIVRVLDASSLVRGGGGGFMFIHDNIKTRLASEIVQSVTPIHHEDGVMSRCWQFAYKAGIGVSLIVTALSGLLGVQDGARINLIYFTCLILIFETVIIFVCLSWFWLVWKPFRNRQSSLKIVFWTSLVLAFCSCGATLSKIVQ